MTLKGWFPFCMAAVLTAQETAPPSQPLGEDEVRRGTILRIIEEVQTLAAVEPPTLGTETLRWLAEILQPRSPEQASQTYESAFERSLAIRVPIARGAAQKELAKHWFSIDAARAEEICHAIPRDPTGRMESDPRSGCYAELITHTENPAARAAVAGRAIAAGALSTQEHANVIRNLQKTDAEAAGILFARFIDAFPARDAGFAEILSLLRVVRLAGQQQPELARKALEIAIQSSARKDFPEPKDPVSWTHHVGSERIAHSSLRDCLYFEIADLAWVVAPYMLKSRQEQIGKWSEITNHGDWDRRRSTRLRQDREFGSADTYAVLGVPDLAYMDLDAMSPAEAVQLARDSKDPRIQSVALTMALMENMRTPGLEAAQLLKQSAARLPDSLPLKMFSFGVLADYYAAIGDVAGLGAAAHHAAASFDVCLGCDSEACEKLSVELSPGAAVTEFVEMIEQHKLSADDLGLQHRSLRARTLLLQLKNLLQEPRTRKIQKPAEP
jgi:hypothetical protein